MELLSSSSMVYSPVKAPRKDIYPMGKEEIYTSGFSLHSNTPHASHKQSAMEMTSSNAAAQPSHQLPRSYAYFSMIVRIPLLFLLGDLLISTFIERAKFNIHLSMAFYFLQIAMILANLLFLFIAFTNTQPFRAGLLRVMVNCGICPCSGQKFRQGDFNSAVWFTLFYFCITVATRTWEIILLWDCHLNICNPLGQVGFRVLYYVFRLSGIGYYFHLKRAVFALCDVKYYDRDSAWLQEKLRHM